MVEKKSSRKKKVEQVEQQEKNEPQTHTANQKSHAQSSTEQPVINIGLVGHVDHGKTTLTKTLSGKWTDTHSEEIKHGITIRLGYADTTFYLNEKSGEYSTSPVDKFTNEANKKLRKVSFIDAPGHESLMATMLAGSMIMDGALLLVSANEQCPQAQTREHLFALQMCGISQVVVVQNKIDLVSPELARENYEQIKQFLKGTIFEHAPIIPISAELGLNISYLIEAIEKTILTPVRQLDKEPLFLVARSFDVNKPGTSPEKLKGGILGGALVSGKLNVGDTIEIRPGRVYEQKNQQVTKSYTTKIVGLVTGSTPVKEIVPGGSCSILTELDPALVKADKLTGNVVGLEGQLPQTWDELKLEVHLLDRVVGSKDDLLVEPLRKMEPLMLNVNSATTVGIISDLSKKNIVCKLKLPICASKGSRVTLSRRVQNRFRLIGYGIIV